jgi:hypothetical protein
MCPQGSQWSQSFQLTNDDGSLQDLTGKTFTFTLRTSPRATSAAVQVTSTASTASGYITVILATSTVQVVLTSAATLTLAAGDVYSCALWEDQNLSDQTALVVGNFYVQPVAVPA